MKIKKLFVFMRRGKPLDDCRLTHSQITEGGELHFAMGDKPSGRAREFIAEEQESAE